MVKVKGGRVTRSVFRKRLRGRNEKCPVRVWGRAKVAGIRMGHLESCTFWNSEKTHSAVRRLVGRDVMFCIVGHARAQVLHRRRSVGLPDGPRRRRAQVPMSGLRSGPWASSRRTSTVHIVGLRDGSIVVARGGRGLYMACLLYTSDAADE